MASIIRVKRSTGTAAPGSLAFGELGLTIGGGATGNKGERLFVGDDGGNVDVVGGKYYTDMLTNGPGQVASRDNPATPANGFIPILLTENGGNNIKLSKAYLTDDDQDVIKFKQIKKRRNI